MRLFLFILGELLVAVGLSALAFLSLLYQPAPFWIVVPIGLLIGAGLVALYARRNRKVVTLAIGITPLLLVVPTLILILPSGLSALPALVVEYIVAVGLMIAHWALNAKVRP